MASIPPIEPSQWEKALICLDHLGSFSSPGAFDTRRSTDGPRFRFGDALDEHEAEPATKKVVDPPTFNGFVSHFQYLVSRPLNADGAQRRRTDDHSIITAPLAAA